MVLPDWRGPVSNTAGKALTASRRVGVRVRSIYMLTKLKLNLHLVKGLETRIRGDVLIRQVSDRGRHGVVPTSPHPTVLGG